ncbi:hypothetical protein GN244_ATG16106 [Phytophthora infestans]|uniref:Uncharacterized protein n=1 Tax=Phytophthora infestans TaxID=4787 RepID=A0A833W6U1_PHYIN|nr:hypothetical protein GN244_ATG16106 [Phytophthora infestans]KAF4150254.1 hypothetical protein GN958_ATG00577 [Phytophthora infestans]
MTHETNLRWSSHECMKSLASASLSHVPAPYRRKGWSSLDAAAPALYSRHIMLRFETASD